MGRGRPSLIGASLFGVCVLWQVWRLLLTPHGVASAWTTGSALPSVSTGGAGVTQEFVMGADGFDGVWVRVVRQPAGADLPAVAAPRSATRPRTILATLDRMDAGRPVPLERRVVAAASVGVGAWHVPFHEVRHSRGMTFRVSLQHVSPADGTPIALAARPDRTARTGRFDVDGEEQWGTLVFEATANRATLPYWKDEILRPWPAPLRSWGAIAGVWLLANLMLARACRRAATLAAQPAVPVLRPSTPAQRAIGAPARAAILVLTLIVAAGTVVAAWPEPALRVIRFADHMTDARIETPGTSIHDTIAVQHVAFGGRAFRTIVALPPTRLAWSVQVPKGALLEGHAAMRPDVWTSESDGVNMWLQIIDTEGRVSEVARYTLLPWRIWEHRAMHPFRVSLDPWAGQRITVVFETDPERWGNAVNDVPVWVEPRIVWPRGQEWGEVRVEGRREGLEERRR